MAPMKIKKRNDFFLTSRLVLLFVFVVALGSIIAYAMARNVFAIVLFSLIGFITSFFSKNMIVVLLIPIVGTAIIQTLSVPYSKMEGFHDSPDEDEERMKDKNRMDDYEDRMDDYENRMDDYEGLTGGEDDDEGFEDEEEEKMMGEGPEMTPEQQVVNIYKDSMKQLSNMNDPEQQGAQMKEMLKKLLN